MSLMSSLTSAAERHVNLLYMPLAFVTKNVFFELLPPVGREKPLEIAQSYSVGLYLSTMYKHTKFYWDRLAGIVTCWWNVTVLWLLYSFFRCLMQPTGCSYGSVSFLNFFKRCASMDTRACLSLFWALKFMFTTPKHQYVDRTILADLKKNMAHHG